METDRTRKPVDFIDLPKDGRGFIAWSSLRQDPADLISQVEREARKLSSIPQLQGGFTNQALIGLGLSGFLEGVRVNYPGGVRGLKEAIGVRPRRATNEPVLSGETVVPYDKKGRIRWAALSRNGEFFESFIISQVQAVIGQDDFSRSRLVSSGRADLAQAITRFFPGGTTGVGQRIEQERVNNSSEATVIPRDSRGRIKWTLLQKRGTIVDVIRSEVIAFGQQIGPVTLQLLAENRSELANAIRLFYPGSWTQLRKDLNIPLHVQEGLRGKDKAGKVAELESYGRSLLEKGLIISNQGLIEAGERWYHHAITRYYPGGIKALREKLGAAEGKATRGRFYWQDLANIEAEAALVCQKYGDLTAQTIRMAGREDLMGAIYRRYPGKLIALKEKLGLNSGQIGQIIYSDEANQQLERLLEAK